MNGKCCYQVLFIDMVVFFLFQVLFNSVLENACSEQGARMSAMDSSSRNAGDMLDRLTLTYNRFSLSLSLSLSVAKRIYPFMSSPIVGTREYHNPGSWDLKMEYKPSRCMLMKLQYPYHNHLD